MRISLLWIAFGILFISVILLMILAFNCPPEYVMPNGVKCLFQSGKASIDFGGCDDGKRYIDPESYKVTNRCIK